MRLRCPICGTRDLREFYCQSAARRRPAAEAPLETWHDYVHLRENPAGETREFWHHTAGCGAWLRVRRDTVNHAIVGVTLAEEGDVA